jgi:uncharacterized membrane protein/uncharacterized membrane protein YbhN (UPF0104 family)
MNKVISTLKYLLGWPLSFISLFFVVKLVYSNKDLFNNLSTINYSLLFIGIIFFLLYFFVRSFLWQEIIKEKGNKLSFRKSTYYWEISEIKRYTPGNIWSFLSRTKLFTNDNMSTKDMVYSLFSETVLIILGCFLASTVYISALFNNNVFDILLFTLSFLSIIFYVFANKINQKIKFKGVLERIKDLLPGDNYEHNFKLYFLSFLAFVFFGIATYFSSSAIFYLNPKDSVLIVSLSVFSLLVGYLSIITPMGLGVREGVMTLGLSKSLTFSQAGLISIFSRIIFILSEIIFLAIVFIINNVKNVYLEKLINLISKYKYETLVLISSFTYFLYYTTASFLRYDNFFTGRFDLGNMDQTVWNTINGRIFQLTDPNGTEAISRLAFHADFILVFLSPLYLLWSNPKMLLITQSLILSLGAIFVFLIGNNLLKDKRISFSVSLAFLINPALGYANLYDFHPVTLATTFLLASFYFILKKNYVFFILFAILAGTTKEHVWAIISLLGLFIIIKNLHENKFKFKLNKELLIGTVVILTSAFMFYFLIWKAIPMQLGGNHFALSYYSDFGNSASEVASNIFLNPIKTISIALEFDKLKYLFDILSPLGFLPLLSPLIVLLSAPDFAVNLLSSNDQLHQIYYQYTSTTTPFLFIAAFYSLLIIFKKFPKLNRTLVVIYILGFSIFSQVLLGPLPGSNKPNIDMFTKQLPNRYVIEKYISTIPKNLSVAATNNLGSHMSQREHIYTIPMGIEKADVIMFLLNDVFAQPTLDTQKEFATKFENNKDYVLLFKDGDFVAFQKK